MRKKISTFVISLEAASGCEGFSTFREITPTPSSGCAGNLVAPKLMKSSVLVLQNHQHILNIGTELGPETSKNLYIMKRLSEKISLNLLLCLALTFRNLALHIYDGRKITL